MLTPEEIDQLNARLIDSEPRAILKEVYKLLPNCGVSFSGAEDVVLIEMAHKIWPELAVFTLDTGRLHPETYRFIEKVRKHYQLSIGLLHPDAEQLEALVNSKGLFSFFSAFRNNNAFTCC